MIEDPRQRVERTAKRTRAAIEQNGRVFTPIADAMVEAIRRGGRLLLLGEAKLHLLAEFAATEIVGRRHASGVQLPVDALDMRLGDAQAVARGIGPFDAIVAIAGNCDDAVFNATLDAARSRGAKVLCVCVGRARLEGRADLAVDIPESRAYHIPGLASIVLHYLAKLAAARLAANPLVRPQRLDDGPPRGDRSDRIAAARAAEGSPRALARGDLEPPISPPVVERPGPADGGRIVPLLEEDESTVMFEMPDDAFDIDFFDGVAESARVVRDGERESGANGVANGVANGGANGRAEAEAEAAPSSASSSSSSSSASSSSPVLDPGPAEADPAAGLSAAPAEDGVLLIVFRCKQCRQPLVAGGLDYGKRASCPYCGRRVKVPHAEGRRYRSLGDAPGLAVKPLPEPDPDLEPAPASASERARLEPVDSHEIISALALEAVSQSPRPVSLRFRLEDARLSISCPKGALDGARVEDLTAEGIEASIPSADAARLEKGTALVVRLECPAFLEPLILRARVERLIDSEPGGEVGRVRALLPLEDDAPREVRERLARLAELAEKSDAESPGSRN